MTEAHARFSRRFRYDPVGFIEAVLPFGKPGPLMGWPGPTDWQRAFFAKLGSRLAAADWGESGGRPATRKAPIQLAISSGTETGKTSLVLPMTAVHLMVCFPGMRGHFISSSLEHAMDKFWPNLNLLIDNSPALKHLLATNARGRCWVRSDPNETYMVVVASGLDLSGLHAPRGMTFSLWDEWHRQTDDAWGAGSGQRQERQSVTVIAGNPARNEGFGYERCFGRLAEKWNVTVVGRQDMPDWDPELEEELVAEHGGKDTWTYRAYVLGQPPLSGSLTVIDRKLAEAAAGRSLDDRFERRKVDYATEPVVVGIDLSRVGDASNCAVWRCGVDARTVEPEQVAGERMSDAERKAWVLDVMTRPREPYGAPAAVYVDVSGETTGLEEFVIAQGLAHVWRPVVFNAGDPSGKYRNVRSALWYGLRAWLQAGGCIRDDPGLVRTICAARVRMQADRAGDRVQVDTKESVRRAAGRTHLDEVDALMLACRQPPLTFPGARVRSRLAEYRRYPLRPAGLGYGG